MKSKFRRKFYMEFRVGAGSKCSFLNWPHGKWIRLYCWRNWKMNKKFNWNKFLVDKNTKMHQPDWYKCGNMDSLFHIHPNHYTNFQIHPVHIHLIHVNFRKITYFDWSISDFIPKKFENQNFPKISENFWVVGFLGYKVWIQPKCIGEKNYLGHSYSPLGNMFEIIRNCIDSSYSA